VAFDRAGHCNIYDDAIAYYFEEALDIMVARDDVTFMTSSQIGDWFVATDGTGGAEVAAFNDGPPA
jgi:hypothetical protein